MGVPYLRLEKHERAKEFLSELGDLIEAALDSYRCQYTRLDGDGLGLDDVLTPPGQQTTELGSEEMELLADHIIGEIKDHFGVTP